MSTEQYDMALNFDDSQQTEADKKLLVAFYRAPIKNEPKSAEAGRPIFDEIDLIKIIVPGSRDSYVGDASVEYQNRFPIQWARYKQGREQTVSGTPLSALSWMTLSQIAEFEAVNVKTIEQLVSMADAVSQKFMGHLMIKDRALNYLNAAKENAPTTKLMAELDKRDETIAELQKTVEALVARNRADDAKAQSTKVPMSAKA